MAKQRPNILVIIADDLGYSDLGCYGGEIQTPHVDRLAAQGVRFTQFYNTARCWPTRSSLLTGYYAQQIRRDAVPGVPSGGRGVRQPWAQLLPAYLRTAGYRSYHSGKWHLDGMPLQAGFDRSYYLRDQGRFFNPRTHYEDDRALPPVPKDSGFYGTTAIGDHAVKCLQEHQQHFAEQPFFHYLAFTAPHFPLHALPEDIARYRDVYQVGWQAIRQQRWRNMRDLGVFSGSLSAVERDLGPPYHFPDHLKILGSDEVNRPHPWEQLSKSQQAFQAAKMTLHAAMIHRMDIHIGRVLDQLEAMGQLDNTLIFFLSDNGASAEIMVRDDGHDPNAEPGSAATYLCLGPGWSTTCNTPFRRHKTWTHEGGISTPLIVSWPDGIQQPGTFRHQVGHVIDLFPTITQLAGVSLPTEFKSRAIPQRPGLSLLDALQQDTPLQREYLWWFHDGHRALRAGDWKIVSAKGEPWELYDLSRDRIESNNQAEQQPRVRDQLVQQWTTAMASFTETAKLDLPDNASRKSKGRQKKSR